MFLTKDVNAGRPATDDFWYTPATAVTSAGAMVSTESALRLSTVYKCVRVRSETIGMLPLLVYRRKDRGGKEIVADHPLYRLLHDAPNPWQTAMQWRQTMQAHLDLRGNAFSQVVYAGNGSVDMLLPLDPDRMAVEVTADGSPRYRYKPLNGKETVFVRGEILHLASLSLDGYTGMNPIEAEREAVGAAMAARDYGARYFANSARPPAWVEMPGKFASQEDKTRWIDNFSRMFAGWNAGKTPVMENGLKLHPLQISNQDAQFLELRKYSDVDICGLFRMPPHKIGILDRATWGNIEHQQLDFVTDTIMPSAVLWEQALLRDLPFEDGEFAEFKLTGLLRGDTKSRYDAYSRGIQDGWLTRNEARALENMNPLPGLDDPLQPLNMTAVGQEESSDDTPDDTAEGE